VKNSGIVEPEENHNIVGITNNDKSLEMRCHIFECFCRDDKNQCPLEPRVFTELLDDRRVFLFPDKEWGAEQVPLVLCALKERDMLSI